MKYFLLPVTAILYYVVTFLSLTVLLYVTSSVFNLNMVMFVLQFHFDPQRINSQLQHGRSVVGSKTDEPIVQPHTCNKSGERISDPGYPRHRCLDGYPRQGKMIGLHPDIGTWEGSSPVFFRIPSPSAKIIDNTIDFQFAGY